MKNFNFKHYIFIVLGSFSLSFGTVTFLSPNQIITGGGIGISLLLHSVFPSITLGIFMAIVSIPFLILSYVYFESTICLKPLL